MQGFSGLLSGGHAILDFQKELFNLICLTTEQLSTLLQSILNEIELYPVLVNGTVNYVHKQ